ncbi:hypothetical protein MFERI14815_00768 [Mycoplasma feriruminatoris]|uniref:restriction endonuclease subunit S n=1 Tax=Mycoplasma feriruminatoris TaxID=1179777 RepID=UPI00241D3176|nr:restriction endonuclease subunit S [Mycoplasma feriruminatoris]WFQ92151.1 hypothetical protein MFERI14815_00768 [Mycoplasma feriruminatoris]
MSEKSLVPKIRFKGFTNAWEQEKLGNLLTYEQPTNYIVKSDKYTSTGIPVLTAGKSFILGYTREKFGIKFANSKNPIIIFDDFTTSSYLINFNFKVKSSAIKLLSNVQDYDVLFFNYLLLQRLNFKPEAHERHWISKFSMFETKVTDLKEKAKIASLFSNLDSLITLHQRKYLALKNFKNTLLEKMFCDEKSKFPRIRFKGFTNAWEQEKLGKLVFYKTSSIILNNLNNNGKYCVYDANGIAGKIDIEPVSEEYISIIKDGAGAGRVRLLPKNTHILSTMGAILPLNTTDIKFVYFLLSKNSHLMKEASGSTIPHIYFKNYSQNIYIVPCNKEQYKISSLFSNLDSLITLHQRKLELLKNIKNTLLEKMFI